MIDARLRRLIDPCLVSAGRRLAAAGLTADTVTLIGFAIGLAAAAAVAGGHYIPGLLLLMSNRLADGLDGAIARVTLKTDRGGFLDITLDFIVYAAFPLGFAYSDPATNALAACFLLAGYLANGSAFLAFSIMAERRGIETSRHGQKSIYYLAGLAEGGETIAFMVLACIFPEHFPLLATAFGAMCLVSAVARLYLGWRLLA